jgi:hypothetical protein
LRRPQSARERIVKEIFGAAPAKLAEFVLFRIYRAVSPVFAS